MALRSPVIFSILLLSSVSILLADNIAISPIIPPQPPNSIQVINAPNTNVRLLEQVGDENIVVELTSNVHNWWLMKLSGVQGKTITIGFSMAGKGNVGKWTSLQPVYTYADPDKCSTFEWFTKDKITGVWQSGSLLSQDNKPTDSNGKTPFQTVIHNESAEEFLSQDGAYWEPWGRITKIQAITDLNIFRMTTPLFTQNEVWIAMRYPFSYKLLQEYVEALRTLHNDNIHVKTIGQSGENRDLTSIEVKSSRFFQPQPLTLLIYAREHATEPDGSWAILGIVNSVLNSTIDRWPRLILLPMLDPDSTVANRYEGIIKTFGAAKSSSESLALQSYVKSLAFGGKRPDISISLHNVESNEAQNIWMPHADYRRKKVIELIKAHVENKAREQGYSVTTNAPEWTFQGNRFEGWLSKNLGSADLVYELNSQAKNGLTLRKLEELGALLVKACDASYIEDEWFSRDQ